MGRKYRIILNKKDLTNFSLVNATIHLTISRILYYHCGNFKF